MADISKIISFKHGTGKENKAAFYIEGVRIPAAAITRIRKEINESASESAINRIFIQKLSKYSLALDILDKNNISYSEALAFMDTMKPKKMLPASGKTRMHDRKEASLVAKLLGIRFEDTKINSNFSKIYLELIELLESKEFQEKVSSIYQEMRKMGIAADGFVRLRPENPALKANAAKARAGKIKKSI